MTFRLLCADILVPNEEDLIAIPVNTMGIAGAGLAKKAKLAYPNWYKSYLEFAKNGWNSPLHIFTQMRDPNYIVSFPTKIDWRKPSIPKMIEDNLHVLKWFVHRNDIKLFGLPLLGCGLGGLDPNWFISMVDKVFDGRYWPTIYVMKKDVNRIELSRY